MNIQVDPTRSNLASAMMNSKIRPRAVVVYGVKIFPPSPPNYVTNRLSYACFFFYEVNLIIWAYFRLFYYYLDYFLFFLLFLNNLVLMQL